MKTTTMTDHWTTRRAFLGRAVALTACALELEYKIPQGSNAVAEVAKCVQYCKEALA